MICFVANSAWYLKNFRSTTLNEFSLQTDVACLFPSSENGDCLSDLDVKRLGFYIDPSSLNPLKEACSLVSLFTRLLVFRPDVVFSFNPKTNLYALIVCWVLRIPCIPNVSGVGVASQLGGFSGKVYNLLSSFFYRRSFYIFFQNHDDYQNFEKAGWLGSCCSEVLPGSGVDLERFSPHRKSDKTLRFLMAVRLIKQKGVEEYIHAARRLLDAGFTCEFFLAGIKDESSRAIDEQVIDALQHELNIHFLGHVDNMPELLKSVDFVVLPSYYPEGVPRNLIEAAASGKLIITTDTPGCREVVLEGENGYLVEPRSIDQLTEAMQMVLELPEAKRSEMQQASRALAEERFDEKIVIRRYLEIAERLTGHLLT